MSASFLGVLAIFFAISTFGLETVQIRNKTEPWKLNQHCVDLVDKFSVIVANFSSCALRYSIPPRICTYCVDEFIHMEKQYRTTYYTINRHSFLNESCSHVIFDGYLVSYVNQIYTSLVNNLWLQSKCDSCLTVNLTAETAEYAKTTLNYEKLLEKWRRCVVNESESHGNVCVSCWKMYESLYSFYWSIYATPGMSTCLDVESTMNDTMKMWRNLFKCKDPRPKKQSEMVLVSILSTVLLIVTVLFYVGSYIQGERKLRNLIKYSKLPTPQGVRSHLISSSHLINDDYDSQFDDSAETQTFSYGSFVGN